MRIKGQEWTFDMMVQEFIDRRYMLNMGSGKLARRYRVDRQLIKNARDEARKIIARKTPRKFPKILVFDIETSPLEAYVWQKEVWKAHIGDDKLISNWFAISWSAKWLFDNEIMGDVLTVEEVLSEDDERIVKSLWDLFDEADIVIAHNGGQFDIPNMNTRFIVNGLQPPRAYQMIDTLKVARKQFGFTHNSLNALAKVFGISVKIETNFELWKRCKHGDASALKEMLRYNKRDVSILEEVYLKIRPWIKSHPNIGLFLESNERKCPVCGSPVEPDGSYYYTMTGKYPTYKCTNEACGSISRGRKSVYDKEKNKNLNVSLAR
jgi:hypothetical protein